MSGLREAFDEIVADIPVYGDLDRAIEQADRERRHRYGVLAGLAAAAAVLVVIAGIVTVARDTDTAPPVSPSPTPDSPSPTPPKSQSPQTWSDTPVAVTDGEVGWNVPDPLKPARDGWFRVAAEHLDPKGDLEPFQSDVYGLQFEWPAEGSDYKARTAAASAYPTSGRVGLMVDPGDPNLLDDGCGYVLAVHEGYPDEQESCSTKRFAGPGGERARVSSWERRCGAWEGGGPAPATCGDYEVAVAVERRDGLIGYVVVDGRGTPDFNPVTRDAMAAAAADPRLSLPERAFAVPSDQAVGSVVEDHFSGYRADPAPYPTEHPGYAGTGGDLGHVGLSVTVRPAGGTPTCGRSSYLIECVERRVFGADDPTTVFVGAWDYTDLPSSYPKSSRSSSRTFVYVGPRHTVVVGVGMVVKADEESLGADLDERLIDLLLDPRLQ
jgi:hypothetical protein